MNFYQYPEHLKKACKDKETIDYYLEFDKEAHKTAIDEKKEKYPQFDGNTMHTTNMPYCEKERWGNRQLRGIVDLLEWVDKEMREEGFNGIFITNRNSLLYKKDKLRYREIMDEFN